jgi:hypothetical protein
MLESGSGVIGVLGSSRWVATKAVRGLALSSGRQRRHRAYDRPVSKNDLPREVGQQPLGYDELVSTLEMIAAEPAIVRLASRETDNGSTAGVASIVGELHQVPARYEGHEFSIGSPYPDRDPEYLAGGILFIREETFESASLTTHDGNDYFVIGIKTDCLHITVHDIDSTYP